MKQRGIDGGNQSSTRGLIRSLGLSFISIRAGSTPSRPLEAVGDQLFGMDAAGLHQPGQLLRRTRPPGIRPPRMVL